MAIFSILVISSCDTLRNFSRLSDCAIVFDSGYMNTSDNGRLIDSYSHVWRVNVRKPHHTRALGRKTDVMSVSFAAENPGLRLIRQFYDWKTLQVLITFHTSFNNPMMYNKACTQVPTPWYFIPIDFASRCQQMIGKKCSTGMLSALFAQEKCDSVHLFGGGNNSGYPYSLINRGRTVRTMDHNMDYEHIVYNRWNNFLLKD
jgi:hypothetical protein